VSRIFKFISLRKAGLICFFLYPLLIAQLSLFFFFGPITPLTGVSWRGHSGIISFLILPPLIYVSYSSERSLALPAPQIFLHSPFPPSKPAFSFLWHFSSSTHVPSPFAKNDRHSPVGLLLLFASGGFQPLDLAWSDSSSSAVFFTTVFFFSLSPYLPIRDLLVFSECSRVKDI